MRILHRPFQLIRENLGAYLVMNAIGYGLFIIGLVAGVIFPELNTANVEGLNDDGTADQVLELITKPWMFALVIFLVNVFTVALPIITLPSLVVPFIGIPLFAYKAFDIGVTLAPVPGGPGLHYQIPHSVTVVIEFQAYVLVMFGAYLLAMALLRPHTVGEETRLRGYLRGLQRFGWIWIPALALFVIGAVYEALSLSYLVSWLAGAMR
ncbi:stage II sporulation protein M [Nocardiopsis sp. CT-R113]|uniref:Stage II sporulation protein M n=1 Tax=Nocardiopsis codii TaxID=3065942 RepID=A0ABU7K5P9_9ACTN|nr:stage II sporulation protein M [Nocardiopsis sp. CT-R113]MEE2037573.1 stage II sporulation protein M [Nocardiopsis sp. CT-R113]